LERKTEDQLAGENGEREDKNKIGGSSPCPYAGHTDKQTYYTPDGNKHDNNWPSRGYQSVSGDYDKNRNARIVEVCTAIRPGCYGAKIEAIIGGRKVKHYDNEFIKVVRADLDGWDAENVSSTVDPFPAFVCINSEGANGFSRGVPFQVSVRATGGSGGRAGQNITIRVSVSDGAKLKLSETRDAAPESMFASKVYDHLITDANGFTSFTHPVSREAAPLYLHALSPSAAEGADFVKVEVLERHTICNPNGDGLVNEFGWALADVEKLTVVKVELKEFGMDGENEHALTKDGEKWTDDLYGTDAADPIVDPVWLSDDRRMDPVCFTMGSTPYLRLVKMAIAPTLNSPISNIALHAVFTEDLKKTVTFHGYATASGNEIAADLIVSNGTFDDFVSFNIYKHSWKVSFDDGNTWATAYSGLQPHVVFLTYGIPKTQPEVHYYGTKATAKRMAFVVLAAQGQTDPNTIAYILGPNATGKARFDPLFGMDKLPPVGQGKDYRMFPWSLLDNENKNKADCQTLAHLMKYQLDLLGIIGSEVRYVYARNQSWEGIWNIKTGENETMFDFNLMKTLALGYTDASALGINYFEGCCYFNEKWWMGGDGFPLNSAYDVLMFQTWENKANTAHQCWSEKLNEPVQYPNFFIIPDVVGKQKTDALDLINMMGCTLGMIAEEYSDTVPLGVVISQNPLSGPRNDIFPPYNSFVYIVVSRGPSVQ
jgi:hypothetical protein